MAERLTIEEINRRYPSEWILLGNPETDETFKLLSGEVLFHSKDRNTMYGHAAAVRPSHFATHFTGKIPADIAFVL
jgi:hypothetical protein